MVLDVDAFYTNPRAVLKKGTMYLKPFLIKFSLNGFPSPHKNRPDILVSQIYDSY